MILVNRRFKGSFLSLYWSLEQFSKNVQIPNSSWFCKDTQGIYLYKGRWLLTLINERRKR